MSSQMQQLHNREVQKYYNEKSFWEKSAELVKKAAKELLEKALWLYYAAESPEHRQRLGMLSMGHWDTS